MPISHSPLAERLRPKTLDDYVGQEHLVGKDGVIRKALRSGSVPSILFWGPPGTGKTTLANIIANELDVPFVSLSAISSGVKEVREVIDKARRGGRILLFIDEIHRFSKSQQDALLAAVEKGIITLIGATTENPSFEVNKALLSRCQVYILESLKDDQLISMAQSSLTEDTRMKDSGVKLKEHHELMRLSGGDARRMYNLLELVAESAGKDGEITDELVSKIAQTKMVKYDKGADMHYDVISAYIKSIRGSDPNAAVYYLARMIEGGEAPEFIARRLVILASEDIGNANPTAIVMATNCYQAIKMIGYPEARIILSQATTYLASSAKSNAAYMAINQAQGLVKQHGDLQVPLHLRGAYTKLNESLGYGKHYKYSHDFENSFSGQEYMPEEISGEKLYDPGKNPREEEMRKRLRQLWKDKYGY